MNKERAVGGGFVFCVNGRAMAGLHIIIRDFLLFVEYCPQRAQRTQRKNNPLCELSVVDFRCHIDCLSTAASTGRQEARSGGAQDCRPATRTKDAPAGGCGRGTAPSGRRAWGGACLGEDTIIDR